MKRPSAHLAAIDELAARWIARRDTGLTQAEQAQFAAWCRSDEKHAAAVARFEHTWAALARPRQAGAVSELTREMADLTRRRGRRRTVATVSSVALIALVVSLVWLRRDLTEARIALPQTALLITPERRTLPDGSIVELKRGAMLTLEFTPTLRRVRLSRGEALFQVTRDHRRPFVVSADGVEVRAVGTAFVVQVNAGEVEVLVTEGRVAVEKTTASLASAVTEAAPASPPTLAFVDAGHRVTVETSRTVAEARAVKPVSAKELDERLAWRAPRVEFSGTPLEEVIGVINRYAVERHHPRFIIADPELGRIKLSGLFRVDDSAGLVQMFETNFDLKAESRGENDIVLRRAR